MRTIVVKYGGAALDSGSSCRHVLPSIRNLIKDGHRVVLVHGGGPEIDRLLTRLSIPVRKEGGLRVTDDATMEVVEMVLCGRVNKFLVAQLEQIGVKAIGICGKDGSLAIADEISPSLGSVGRVRAIKPAVLEDLMDSGYLPVVASVAAGASGNSLNINADDMAAAIAASLQADDFVLLTDVAGVLLRYPDPDSRIPILSLAEAEVLEQQGKITSGMLPKLQACKSAVKAGVGRAVILDGRHPAALCEGIRAAEDLGTVIVAERSLQKKRQPVEA